ncbi:hypothetical protein SADUNF_Sadunf11G0089000 [Salix dunnii]|uniref:Uncharacterized protein n=1 Tax=Salix dunnii TaxID=1413687 RepID=A0A835JM98_9ROSI|nr:hypothetical protein SADUNF_Sadunf11G0089000 [Salix dunnii]
MKYNTCHVTGFRFCFLTQVRLLFTCKRRSRTKPGQLTILASTFRVMLTMHFSGKFLIEHPLSWKKRTEKKAIIIIILMAPIYAINSFVGLVHFQGSKHWNTSNDFNFIFTELRNWYLQEVLAFGEQLLEHINKQKHGSRLDQGSQLSNLLPKKTVTHCSNMNHHTLKLLKYWTCQFVVILPICCDSIWGSWTFKIILNGI